jgi:CheY-like chemotaxis protein/anti-sigma regulatory factor (Ser/Thr protein kinase)
MSELIARKPLVLVVEDDPHNRSFMESSLQLSGYEVVAVESAEAARAKCLKTGLEKFSAVLSDYRLPNETGIGLVDWIRSKDKTLSTLIITGQGEKSIVQRSLSVGVFEYLEKPVTHQDLREILKRAVDQTNIQRQHRDDRLGLEELKQFDQTVNIIIPMALRDRMTVLYRPLHEVGGDFLITHDHGDGCWTVLIGDVSGHDIRSGYVSTYFQGMFRGCLGSGGQVESALELFNRSLRDQEMLAPSGIEPVSLSVSAINIGVEESIQHWNYGFTPCHVVSSSGRITECPYGRFPLGWVEKIDIKSMPIRMEDSTVAYIFTDGLLEFANILELNFFSLLYRFLDSNSWPGDLPLKPSDDILIVRFLLIPEVPLKHSFEPILSEHYAGTEMEHIDQLQSNWRRSLNFALEGQLGDRLYDLLICIREGMLNAFVHGCERSPEKFAHLQVSINNNDKLIRVHIDDPGKGHSFDLKQRLVEIGEKTGKHLGLGIIQHLSDEFQVENRGTSLVFDFKITPEKS